MTTRTRSRARQQAGDEAQGRITDTFKATRRGPTAPGKLLTAKDVKEEVIVKQEEPVKAPVVLPEVDSKKASESAPVAQKVAKKAASARTTKKAKQELVLPTEKITVEAPVPPALDSPPRRARKTPTPTNSPQAPKSVRRLVFDEDKAPIKEEKAAVKAPVEIPSSSSQPPAVVTPPFGLVEKKRDAKTRSVADLQARLAEKSAAMKRIHASNAAGKSRQVSELSEVLKSPQKSVHLSPIKKASSISHRSPVKKLAPLFAATPSKRSEAIKINSTEGSASKIPDYVLPSHKTPAKEAGSDEELEKQSRRELLERGKNALLLDSVKQNQDVDLPPKYQSLLDQFHRCDRIVSFFLGKDSRCESKEIFKNVSQNMNNKTFSKEHMAQILTVYPKSYNLRLEEQRSICGKPNGRYDLVLDVNLEDDLTQFMRAESPVKQSSDEALPKVLPGRCLSPMKSPRKKVAPALPREAELDVRRRLEGWRMSCRKYVMHHLLAERVKNFHKRFMEKLGEKVGEFRRFHPSFLARMERECDDIEQAALPEPPARKEMNFTNAREFMNSLPAPTTAVDEAIKELSGKGEMSASRNIPLSPKKFAQMAATKPAGTKSLLERIREKELQKKATEAARDPVAERRYFSLELLHSKILRSVLNIFVQKGCRSMEHALVVEKLEYSTKRTRAEIRECLELMCDVAKDVANVVEVASRKYLQIEKDKHEVVLKCVKTELEKAPKPAFPFGSKAR